MACILHAQLDLLNIALLYFEIIFLHYSFYTNNFYFKVTRRIFLQNTRYLLKLQNS